VSISKAGNGADGQEIARLYGILHYMKTKDILINYHDKHWSRDSSVGVETS
jgi:hypothetical protein